MSSLALSTAQGTGTTDVLSSVKSSNVCTPMPVVSAATHYISPCSTGFNTDGLLEAPSTSLSFDQGKFFFFQK